MVQQKGLGRGLDALFSGEADKSANNDTLKMLNVAQMQPGKYQPRYFMDEQALQTLADSIKSQGIMQPILVRELANQQYEIIAGERRWRASQLAGITEVPVLVRDIADESALAMALIENIQRENLNPLEEAHGIKRLIDEFSMTHEKAAEAVGRSRVAVSNLLRLLNLCTHVQDLLMHNKLDMGHARALIGIDAAQQILFANKMVNQQLSVREAESLVKNYHLDAAIQADNQHKTKFKTHHKTNVNHDITALQDQLSEKIGAVVHITGQASGAGMLKIGYHNLDQLDEIIKKMMA